MRHAICIIVIALFALGVCSLGIEGNAQGCTVYKAKPSQFE